MQAGLAFRRKGRGVFYDLTGNGAVASQQLVGYEADTFSRIKHFPNKVSLAFR